jgi:4-amino-4-deoxy-L-arabinose transferase-like glycosyltransferase
LARRSRKKNAPAASAPRFEAFCQKLESWIKAHARKVLIATLALNALTCLVLFDPKPHTGGDNASYIILAESVLRSGDGYSDNITPGPPKPHTQYGFGYPLLLSPLVWLFGRNVVLLKLFSLVLAVGSVALFSLLAKRMLPPVAWAGLTLAAALNPVIVDYSHWILSEIAFLFFSLLSLYLMSRSEDSGLKGKVGRWFWLGVLSLTFTAHIRTIGLGFAIAGFAYYGLRRSWIRLLVFTLAVSVLLAPWMIRNRMAKQGEDKGYAYQLLLKNPYSPEEGTIGVAGLPARALRNVRIYAGTQLARVVLGSEGAGQKNAAVVAISVLCALLISAGLIARLAAGPALLEVYVLVYLGVVLIWPEAWSDVRFLMPVVPLLLLYLVRGVELGARAVRFTTTVPGITAAAAGLVLALVGLGSQLVRVPENLGMVGDYLAGDRYAGYPVNWRHLYGAADWVKENTPESSVVTVRKPRLFYLHTGRKVNGYPFTTDRDSVFAEISRTDYVVIDAVSGTTYRYLLPAVQEHKESFKVVFALQDPLTAVLEVQR